MECVFPLMLNFKRNLVYKDGFFAVGLGNELNMYLNELEFADEF